MIIAIDGNEANVKNRVGVSVYTFELLKRFHSSSNRNAQFIIYLRTEALDHMPKSNEFFSYKVVRGPFLWRDLFFPLSLFSSTKADVLFSPAHYTPRFSPIPLVTTIHDLSYLFYPQEFLKKDLYKLVNWTKHAVNVSKKIIAVSEHTRKDVMKHYGISPEKVVNIHNGYSLKKTKENSKTSTALLSKIDIKNDPYILYVGTIQPRKNISTLISAFKKALDEKPKLKLVIAGKKGWLYKEIFNQVKKENVAKSVIFTGYVPDEDIAQLYAHAQVFIQPSFYEGFGLPLLEAMSFGCPVIAAKGSSMEEVGGNACVYFDPHDTIELQNKILELLDNNKLRETLEKKGKTQIKKFSWDTCASETLKVLEKVASTK